MGKKMQRMLFGTIILCIALSAEKITGAGVHMILGMVLIGVGAAHSLKKRNMWAGQPRGVRRVDAVLGLSLMLMFLSGTAIHMDDSFLWAKIAHKSAALLFILGVFGHIVQHKKNSGKEGRSYVSQKLNEGV